MALINTTDSAFEQDVLKKDGLVLVDFWASWCGPCKQIAPSLEDISNEMADTVTVAKLDVDENPTTMMQYGVRGLPTLMLFKNGQPISTKVGADGKGKIVEWIETASDEAAA